MTWTPRHRPRRRGHAPRAKRSQQLYNCQDFAGSAESGTVMATGYHLPRESSWHLLNMPWLNRSLNWLAADCSTSYCGATPALLLVA